jgi:hypothetical protein
MTNGVAIVRMIRQPQMRCGWMVRGDGAAG